MNNLYKTVFFILLGSLLPACRKEEIPLPKVEVITYPVTSISRTYGFCKGSFVNLGSDKIISFGFCMSTKPQPTFADSRLLSQYLAGGDSTNGSFQSGAWLLTPGTTYYIKAYAITAFSKIYGKEESFTTKPATAQTTFNQNLTYQSVTDIDGNSYKTIRIGTQDWLAENLKTTRFNDGTSIPLVTNGIQWDHLETPGYCWYNNDETVFKNIYGGYYNWYSVVTGKLCPSGWHVPDENDWKTFKLFLGMTPEQVVVGYFPDTNAGNKIKETGTVNWVEESVTASNESGFTALPGGARSTYPADFGGEGLGGGWWSAWKPENPTWTLSHWVSSDAGWIFKSDMLSRNYGLNVRCVKD
jgi:uncharacterized protein (TIGR02145 family)